MKVVVDTDILSEIQRGKNAQVLARAGAHERAHGGISLSVLSVFEVVQGWQQRGRADRAAAFLAWIEPLEIVPFDLGSARLAGEIGGALMRAGRPMASSTLASRRPPSSTVACSSAATARTSGTSATPASISRSRTGATRAEVALGAEEFSCDGLFNCAVGEICRIVTPVGDGCFSHTCEALPAACVDDPTCECLLAQTESTEDTCELDEDGNPTYQALDL